VHSPAPSLRSVGEIGSFPESTYPRSDFAPSPLRRNLVYSALYILVGLVEIVPRQHVVSHTIWLPGGIALGAMIFCGFRFLPFLFCAHLATRLLTGYPWFTLVPSALVAVAQSAVAYLLLRWVRFSPALRTVRDTLWLLSFGAALPCLLCLPLAYANHFLTDHAPMESFLQFGLIYVLRGAAGVVGSVPLILAFAPGRRAAWLPARKLEFLAITGLTGIAAGAIFFHPQLRGQQYYPLSFLPFPFLVWAALRLGLQGLSVCTLIVAILAVQATAVGRGPFIPGHDLTAVLIVWAYIWISVVTSLLLCVSREERRELEEMLIDAGELERIRLGTELHDDICQHLAGIGFMSGLLRERPDLLHPAGRAHIDQICREIQTCIQSMRNLARGLSPLGIGTQSLTVALTDLAALSESVYGIECRFIAFGSVPELDRETTTHLFRIMQEAVSNSVKHGHAQHVTIIATVGNGRLDLTISDDGTGLPVQAPDSNGLGFKTMAYRADLMNGSFSVQSRKDTSGAVVACSIPLLTA